MAGLSAGRYFKIGIAILLSFQTACIFFPQEKPLNPKLLFTVGSQFLDNAKTLALKGDIDFSDGRATQSGKFTIFINGQDSLALLIEGPLSIDVFRMVIFGDSAYIYSGEERRWISHYEWYKIASNNYGISHFPPWMVGVLIFPQFYLRKDYSEGPNGSISYNWHNGALFIQKGNQSQIIIADINGYTQTAQYYYYSHRKDFASGYYPSVAEFPLSCGKITLHINKLRINPQIPPQVWERK